MHSERGASLALMRQLCGAEKEGKDKKKRALGIDSRDKGKMAKIRFWKRKLDQVPIEWNDCAALYLTLNEKLSVRLNQFFFASLTPYAILRIRKILRIFTNLLN